MPLLANMNINDRQIVLYQELTFSNQYILIIRAVFDMTVDWKYVYFHVIAIFVRIFPVLKELRYLSIDQ